jgi:hypothetical protein
MKHKDIYQKKIVNIREEGSSVIVEYKDHIHYFIILPLISDIASAILDYKDKNVSLITYNTRANLDKVIESWTLLSELQMLSIYFVNPNSNTDKKWIIYPFTHSQISEQAALKQGLQTLFESVEPYVS